LTGHRLPKRKELENPEQSSSNPRRSRPSEDQKAYLESIKDPSALDFDCLQAYNSQQKKSLRSTLKSYWRKNPAVEVSLDGREGRCYYNLAHNILNLPKRQLDMQLIPSLTTISGPVLRINDALGQPLVVKCGEAITTQEVRGNIGQRVMNAALEFCRHTGGGEEDKVRHTSHVDGVPSTATVARSRCQLIHRAHAGRMEAKISAQGKNVVLHPGPSELFSTNGKRDNVARFLQQLQPLSQIQDVCFQHFLPREYELYIKIAKALPKQHIDLNRNNPYPVEFGCWPSRSIVLNSPTAAHRDLDDACWGFCCIVPQGSFTGGYLCLPTLGIKVYCPPGTIIFLRSYALPHYVSDFSGTRISFISFMHQEVVDVYQKSQGCYAFPFDDMPLWYQRRPRT
jgi:hypothetical protein